MRMRLVVWGLLLAGSALFAGCKCVDCMCHCSSGGAVHITTESGSGFDCDDRCDDNYNGCGAGNVSSAECLDTKLVDGKPTTVRCAEARTVGVTRR